MGYGCSGNLLHRGHSALRWRGHRAMPGGMNASAQSGLAQQFAAGDLPDNRIVRLPPLVRRYSWHVSLLWKKSSSGGCGPRVFW